MESISFRKFLKDYSQNLENESIQLKTTGVVEGKKDWDLTNTLEVFQLDASISFSNFKSQNVSQRSEATTYNHQPPPCSQGVVISNVFY